MRGRLIFPFVAELHRLDTQAMEPDYDEDFKEPILIDADDDGIGEPFRREHPPVRVPCQVEPEAFEALRMATSGNTPKSSFSLVLHFRVLERLGLVDAASGDALIRPSDRLGALYARDGQLVQAMRTPPGLYVTGGASHRLRAPPASAQPQPAARLLPGSRSRTEWNMMKPLAPTALAVVCLGAHCRPIDGYVWGATRCTGNTAEICNADGSYHEFADCDDVSERSGAPFVCAFVDETTEDGHITGNTCVPSNDADGAAGGER